MKHLLNILLIILLTCLTSCLNKKKPNEPKEPLNQPVQYTILDFIKDDYVNELNELSFDIMSQVINDIDLIDQTFKDGIKQIYASSNILDIKDIYKQTMDKVYSYIPKANGFIYIYELFPCSNGLLQIVENFIHRNHMIGLSLGKHDYLNINILNKEDWQALYIDDTSEDKEDYYEPNILLKNDFFLKGMSLCIDKDKYSFNDFKTDVNYDTHKHYNYDLDLSRLYFSAAIFDILNSNPNLTLSKNLSFDISLLDTDEDIDAFYSIKKDIEDAFNHQSVTNNEYTLTVNVNLYPYEQLKDLIKKGRFDLSRLIEHESPIKEFEGYRMLSTTKYLNYEHNYSFSMLTNDCDKACIVYKGYRYSYDAFFGCSSATKEKEVKDGNFIFNDYLLFLYYYYDIFR